VSACSLQRYRRIAHSIARVSFDRVAGRQFEFGPCTARGPFLGPSRDRGQLDVLAHERRLPRNPSATAQILRQLAVVISPPLDRGGQKKRVEESPAISSAFMLWMRNRLCRSCPQARVFPCMKWRCLLASCGAHESSLRAQACRRMKLVSICSPGARQQRPFSDGQ
jgi:hypothetical protein